MIERVCALAIKRANRKIYLILAETLSDGHRILSRRPLERTLRELFEPFGTVSEVKLITDRETGQSRGFGFVTMGNVSEGNAAIEGLDGQDKGGRKVTVNEARPKDDRGGRPSPGSRR